MRFIKLTNGMEAQVDDIDYMFISETTWYGNVSGSGKQWYAFTGKGKHAILMHHYLLDFTYDGLNNQKNNLVILTREQHRATFGPRKDNKLGLKGVSFHMASQKYVMQIMKGEFKIVEFFCCKDDAARAYDKYAIQMFGETAYLNFPHDQLPNLRP